MEILDEVLAGTKKEDPLLAWMTDHKDVLRLKETADPTIVNKVVTEGYAPDLTDDELAYMMLPDQWDDEHYSYERSMSLGPQTAKLVYDGFVGLLAQEN